MRWRAERWNLLCLSEGPAGVPPEALLQQVWLHQRIVPEKLVAADGTRIRILHPGFLNREAGPDFRQALVQVGDNPPASGDIEIDLDPAGWEQHAHASNPAYEKVLLHVTWDRESRRPGLASIALKPALDSTVAELSFWLGVQPKAAPPGLAGQCAAPLRALEPAKVREILQQAAQARLRCKAEQLQARARQAGWEGTLWEGLFAALGYKRNVWPMRRLAELRPIISQDLREADAALHLQARLFGIAGLLPTQLQEPRPSEEYLRTLWHTWWRESAQFRDQILPTKFWNLAGIRPANHPQRRLALAARWLAAKTLPTALERWLERKVESPDLASSLAELLETGEDPFWSYRWTFRAKPWNEPQQLLGSHRATDIAMNVILPWLYVRACAGANDELAAAAEQRYLLWPGGEDNSVLRLARQRLFGGVPASFLKTAAQQQGVLQIVKDFCDQSNSACQDCLFPELVSSVTPEAIA